MSNKSDSYSKDFSGDIENASVFYMALGRLLRFTETILIFLKLFKHDGIFVVLDGA